MSSLGNLLISNNFFPLLLTIGVYIGAVWLQKKTKSAICNPILVSAIIIIPILLLLNISIDEYQEGTSVIYYFLTPATICLALSMYEQLQKLKDDIAAIFIGVAAGTIASLGSVLVLCLLLKAEHRVAISLLPKSATSAIGLVLIEQAGGIPALGSVLMTSTGLLGNLFGATLCKLLHINNPIARGVAYGTASHVIGTSKAIEESQLTGAVSGLSLVVAGILTAIVFPFVVPLLP